MSTNTVLERRLKEVRNELLDVMDADPRLQRRSLMDVLANKIHGATRPVVASKDGQITDIVHFPDHGTQLRALNMALALRNEFPAKQLNISGHVTMERLPDLSHMAPGDLMKLAGFDESDVIEGEIVSDVALGSDPVSTNN